MKKPKPIVTVDVDNASYIGDGRDGVYFEYGTGPDGKFYVSTMVDSDTGHFVDDLRTDDGPFNNVAEAIAHGQSIAEGWCRDNDVCCDE